MLFFLKKGHFFVIKSQSCVVLYLTLHLTSSLIYIKIKMTEYNTMQIERIVSALNSRTRYKRHALLKKLRKSIKEITSTQTTNPFVRSVYSFSNHSPSMMAYLAYKSDLGLIGIFDMESLEGVKEFKKGCKLFGISTCVGTDVQVDPHIADSGASNCGFIGIADQYKRQASKFLKPYRERHRERVAEMVDRINKKIKSLGIKISFVYDVYILSKYIRGGTITEKHVWLALANKLVNTYGKGENLIGKLETIGEISDKERVLLGDVTNPFYEYDLAKFLKIIFRFDQKPHADHKDIINFANTINALTLYELRFGSNGREQEIVESVKTEGYDILAFDPRVMKTEEVENLVALCQKAEIIALPLEIIDFPRKKFDTSITDKNLLSTLEKNAWAIAGHELLVSKGEGGFKDLGDISFDKKIEILAGVIHPQYFDKN